MYSEHRIGVGADLWCSDSVAGEQRILPDGCVDLIFDGDDVSVAGPDTVARVHRTSRATRYVGVRLHAGLGPVGLAVAADELCDTTVPLADVVGSAKARPVVDRVSDDPTRVLESWARSLTPDPFGARLHLLLSSGRSVSEAADALGFSARQLQRRTRAAFGYGPAHLSRVLRLGRAVAAADRGLPWAQVAAETGYADQAHLSRDVRDLAGTTPSHLRGERVRSVQDTGGAVS